MSTEKMIEAIEKMKVGELVELVEALKEKFNVQGAPVAMAAAPAAGGDAGGDDDAPSTVSVVLKDAGGSKIKVIKAVKAALGLGLKDSKALVDQAPVAVKEGISEKEAEELKSVLVEAGADIGIE
ncbi:50S ribosomal protein L7/L12 [bacterium]|nr:50S ribosomal protein L7/L12 [bacterium]